MNQNYIFIINPKAGSGGKDSVAFKIQQWITVRKIKAQLVFTEYAGHATKIAANANHDDVVVAVGGDGTVNEVCKGLIQSRGTLGIIPCGSGNGLARHLKIPMDITQALEYLVSKNPQQLDIIEVNKHLSVNVSGIGFDAAVSEAFAHAKGRGLKNYIKIIVKLYSKYQEFNYKIDGTAGKAWMISICNSSQFGNDAIISPKSEIGDQQFELAILNKPHIFSVFKLARQLMNGKITDSPYYKSYKLDSAKIEVEPMQPFHADGEFIGRAVVYNVRISDQLKAIGGV